MIASSMSILIRGATSDDIEALLALDTYLPIDPERGVEIGEWVRGGHCVVAEQTSSLVGYAAVRDSFFRQPMIEILMVAAEHRRSGIGRMLLRDLRARNGAKRLWTSTNESNLATRSLLSSEGFVFAGAVEGLTEGDPELFYHT
jgi:GNAT superfamily N-acetyltransferase